VRLEYQQRLEKKAFKMSIVLMLRDLDHHDRAELIDKLVEGNFNIPHSQKSTLSRSVIYQWLREYTKDPGDFEVLLPKERKDRNTFRRISEEQKKALVRWRSENAARSASELRDELLAHAITSQDPVPSAATIARFLRSVNHDFFTLCQIEGVQNRAYTFKQAAVPGAGCQALPQMGAGALRPCGLIPGTRMA